MSQILKHKLPPNPYKRSPIKKREDLAGRARELKVIRYYLGLTAAGQSPHLALIGQRGVGKTSLLNGAEFIARDLKLLPVRLDMNELKANSQWIFWRDLYQTLALAMVTAGCWGGEQGIIYAEILRMIHSRKPGSLDKAVMQIPYVFSCHQGNSDSFECPDSLVVHDFKLCLVELQSKGYLGIALLIDEADCLGKNVPLLQMFRNIFQIVEYCSLILAGTDAVFPALSEVFSPIPRQFHRVDVKPFPMWSDTMELVLNPISKELFENYAPEAHVLKDLHQLCGGAPDEIQLYCHHMYRSVEDGSLSRMSLSPKVFREVLREYRSNTPANVDAVLNAIERLPDKLLFQSKWLSRRNLALEENILVSVLIKELKLDRRLSSHEKSEVEKELKDGYHTLFEAGITEIDNYIRLAGAPLTAGFWKSFVEVEKGKRWSWNDDLFEENLNKPIIRAVGKSCGALAHFVKKYGNDAKKALFDLRAGLEINEVDESMGEMIFTSLIARESEAKYAIDITYQWNSPAGRRSTQIRFIEKLEDEMRRENIEKWIVIHEAILCNNNISFVITEFSRWKLPTQLELHRLGFISRFRIPDVFGPNLAKQAYEKFVDGDVNGCQEIFAIMLADKKEDFAIRNNVAFCQIITGDIPSGLENATKSVLGAYEPLYELNKGIAEFLNENCEEGRQCLRNALKELRVPENKFISDAAYILILEPLVREVRAYPDMLIEVAILINLWRMGDLSKDEVKTELATVPTENVLDLLSQFIEP